MRISDWSSDVCSSDLRVRQSIEIVRLFKPDDKRFLRQRPLGGPPFGSDLIVRKQPRDVVHRIARQVLRDFGDRAIGGAVWIMLAQPAQRARRRDDDDVVAVDSAVIAQKDRKNTSLNYS